MPHKKHKQGGTKRRTQKENPREKPQTKRGRLWFSAAMTQNASMVTKGRRS